MIKLHVLGSNGWYPTSESNTVCLLIETDKYYVVLDAGSGLSRLDEYTKKDKPIYLFLSHFHLDHTYGLHTLTKFRFNQGLTIFGQPGTKKILHTLINSPFTMPLKNLPYPVTVQELSEGKHFSPKVPFPIEARYLVHADPCFGYRLTIEDKVVTYCTDTGYCDNMKKLAKNADLFIAECVLNANEQPDPKWPHLSPNISAQTAKEAEAKKLLLTHFSTKNYRTKAARNKAKAVAEETFSPVVVANDSMELEL